MHTIFMHRLSIFYCCLLIYQGVFLTYITKQEANFKDEKLKVSREHSKIKKEQGKQHGVKNWKKQGATGKIVKGV